MSKHRSFTRFELAWVTAAALLYGTQSALATADGPDFYSVTGVANGDVPNIREEPSPHAKKLGEIPPDGTCVRNLGCKGGLTMQEFTDLSRKQKAERLRENPRWCKVEYQGVEGWVAGRFLHEGSCSEEVSGSGSAPKLQHLVGARGRDGELELKQLGYSFQGARKDTSRPLTFYKEPETGRCLQVVTGDGRYQSLDYADETQCQSAAEATVIATGKTSLSGKPGSESFQTVCGVIVDSKTYRYLCQVTDINGDKGIGQTALRFPDNELQLVWGEGNKVRVQPQGVTPEDATYSTSEGETDIFFDGKTYFYYSDRGLAAMEVEHFKP